MNGGQDNIMDLQGSRPTRGAYTKRDENYTFIFCFTSVPPFIYSISVIEYNTMCLLLLGIK